MEDPFKFHSHPPVFQRHITNAYSKGFVSGMLTENSAGGVGSILITPFLVYPSVDNSFPPYPILKVYPGKIAGIVPTLEDVKLTVPDSDEGDHPWFYPPGTSFSFFLRCKITIDPDNLFRSAITEVIVVSDDDPLAVPDISPDPPFEIPELTVLRTEEEDEFEGHFYIRIADISMTTIESNIVYVPEESTQWLFSNYTSFASAGTEITILA